MNSNSSKDKDAGITVLNPASMAMNMQAVESCRTVVTVLGGITAGTLGLTGLYGFAFFFIVTLTLGLALTLLDFGGSFGSSFVYFSGSRL